MKTKIWAIAMTAVLGVASCGDTLGQQLLTGGGIGGVAAAATGGDVDDICDCDRDSCGHYLGCAQGHEA